MVLFNLLWFLIIGFIFTYISTFLISDIIKLENRNMALLNLVILILYTGYFSYAINKLSSIS
ncbi:hypothetical protein Bp8pS_042 [Bacillus phage vB_BpuM-BpSp]|nr:hypothetical protein Bp8pS_042 [Bacillus phage vB_BpuM-BpSp]